MKTKASLRHRGLESLPARRARPYLTDLLGLVRSLHASSSGAQRVTALFIGFFLASATPSNAMVSITESGGSTDVNEAGPTSDTYTIVLDSQPTADVEITVSPDGQVDLGAGGGNALLLIFTSATWNVAQMLTVTAVDDAAVEGAHTSTITHSASSADPDFNGIAIGNVVANITDNDTTGVAIAETGTSTDVSESGPTSDSYTLVLNSQPSANVDITVTPDTETDLGSGAGVAVTITFTTASWFIPRTVVVTAVDDATPEGPHTSTITHTASSADAAYNGIAIANVTVNITDNDAAGVTISQTGGTTDVAEAGPTSDTYTIILDIQPTANVDLTIDPDAQTDVGAGGGTAIVLTFTTTNWNVARQVTVTAVDDLVPEGLHTSTITHTAGSADAAYNGIAINNVIANITDNDQAAVTIVESGGSTDVNEVGPTSDTYTIVLGSLPTATVTVTVDPDIDTSIGSGAGVADVLTFTTANWNTAQTVTVTAVDDAIAEGAHTSIITHTATSADSDYNGIAIANVTANVTDNDTAGVGITQSGGSTNVSEAGPTSDTYTIVLDTEPTANVTVTVDPDIQTDIGSGAGVAAVLTFTSGNWNVAQTITVTAVDDALIEGAHTSTITHSAASGDANYNGIAIPNVLANISDNDMAGASIVESGGSTDVNETGPTSDTYTIVLDAQPTADVNITVDPDNETDAGSGAGVPVVILFTSANWNTPRTVVVSAVDDAVQEGPHTSTITHTAASADTDFNAVAISNVVANITDNDVPGVTITQSGGSTDVDETGPTSDSYSIILDSPPSANVDITIDPDNQTDLGLGAGTAILLTFTAGNWTIPQTVIVTAVDDNLVEGNHASTITHTAASGDVNYNGIAITNVTANITDNDVAGVTLVELGGSTDVSEQGPTSDTYTIVLDAEPIANVDITVDPDTQTDLGGGAGAAIVLTFTPANWNVAQTVTVTAVDDAVQEGLHSSTITHSPASADANFNGIAVADVTANVTDNDLPGVTITPSGGSTDVDETGPTSDTYTIVLESQPTNDVNITVDPDAQTDIGAGAGTAIVITVIPGNWNVAQTITVTAVDDAVAEGNHTSTITHTAASGDAGYNGIAVANVVANVTDNDTAGVAVVESAGSTDVDETGPTSDTYTVVLDSEPTANVTITVDPDSQTDLGSGSGVAIVLTFTAGDWNAAQTLTVTGVDDAVAEGNHTSTITHTAASGDAMYNGIGIANVVANVTDNDTAGVTIVQTAGSTDVDETGPTSDTYTVVLDSEPTANVSMTVDPDSQTDLGSGSGVAIVLAFTAGNWNVAQTVTVTAVDDAVDEGNHTSTITHSAGSADALYNGIAVANIVANVTDNDTAGVTVVESGGSTGVDEAGPTSDTYTIVLDSEPTANVNITVDPDSQTDLGSGSGAAIVLTFTAGNWNAAQTVTVTAVDDPVVEGNHTSTITHTAGSGDVKYNGIAIPGVTAAITDNDIAGVTIVESGGSTNVNETGPTSDTYTIVLDTQPSANVDITVDPDTETDLGGGPDTAIVVTFTAGNWNTAQTVTVTAVVDAFLEGPHTSTITHSAASGDTDYGGIPISNVVANVTDLAGVTISQTNGSTDVNESGPTSDSYTIVLNSAPTADVKIFVDPDGQVDVGAGPAVSVLLTFTPANWNVAQTVAVSAVDDAVFEGNHNSTIRHIAVSIDVSYDGLAIANLTVNVTDNDPPPPSGGGGGGLIRLPIADHQAVTTDEDVPVEITLSGSQGVSSTSRYFVVSPAGHGTLIGEPPQLLYTPEPDYVGPDSFTFIVVTQRGEASKPGTVDIEVVPVNDAPVAFPQRITVYRAESASITLKGFDVDEGNVLTFRIVDPPDEGVLIGEPPSLSYLASDDFLGEDRFSYIASDGQASSTPVNVAISIVERLGAQVDDVMVEDDPDPLGEEPAVDSGDTSDDVPGPPTPPGPCGLCGTLSTMMLCLCLVGLKLLGAPICKESNADGRPRTS